MHEEARERSEVQRPAGPQLLRKRSKRADERTDRVGGGVGKRALGLDIEDSDDDSANTKRDCELGDDARQRCNVVGIDLDVRRELGASEPDRAACDPRLDRDAVGHDRVSALRDEPQSTVLQHEHRRHDPGHCVVEAFDRCLDRPRRLDAAS